MTGVSIILSVCVVVCTLAKRLSFGQTALYPFPATREGAICLYFGQTALNPLPATREGAMFTHELMERSDRIFVGVS